MNLWGWRWWITLQKKMKTRWHLPNTNTGQLCIVEAQPHSTYTNLLPRSSPGCWAEWSLRCLVTLGFCEMKTKQQLGLNEPRLQIRCGTGSLPGPPRHWWLCPELLHRLELPPVSSGQGAAGCSDNGGWGGFEAWAWTACFFPFTTAQASLRWPQIVLNSQLQLCYES